MNIYKEYNPPTTSSGVYLKFEDGEPVKLRIASEPVIFNSEYQGNVSTRYAWLVWNFDAEAAQVMVLPITGFRMVAELANEEDWGDPKENPYNIKVKRSGTGKDTRYSVTPSVAKESLDENQQNEVKGLDLVSLVQASPSASNVQYLSDVVKEGRKTTEEKDVIAEVSDEPISLDDIPF